MTGTGRCRRRQFENTLLVQSWRIYFDDIEMVNSKGKSKDASVSARSTLFCSTYELNNFVVSLHYNLAMK